MNIFVPGRLCLFGEHSDWAATYQTVNPKIEPGYALVVGTNQGIYARVKAHQKLCFHTINQSQVLELAMEQDLLLGMAQTTNFFRYVSGVAYQTLVRYGVGGLEIDNYLTDLPLQKGLSSSAAVCVLVAKAFNQIYDLGLTIEGEMDLAYWGERTTPSQCGRLDQACAYGNQPILMTFAGETSSTQPLIVGQEIYLIIVDLAGFKDTQTILTRLNQCYPLAESQIQAGVHKHLGKINAILVQQAILALNQGDAQKIGNLMNQAQSEFDRLIVPACPEQLQAPILHRLLEHQPLQKYIYGGKGVGSQGDGTAQLVARDRISRHKAISLIQQDFPQMHCYELDIPAQSQ